MMPSTDDVQGRNGMDASHPRCSRFGGMSGPSRADGIKVPVMKSKLFMGKPEGPR
jgi:hypothetical protein